MPIYDFAATCLFGLEKLLGTELDALGYSRTETMDGRVYFRGGLDAIPRCNLGLRTAERVYLLLGRFPARTFTELFDGTTALPWEEFIGKDDAFPVKGHAIRSALFSVPDCQSIVKKAIVDRLGSVYGKGWFAETGKKYQIDFFLFKDVAALMIDTSGTALHKRGYRPAANAAPLRETLAAALAMTARPRNDVLFWDPMCGSGTIPIEAAMLQSKTAPGLGRGFAAEDYPWVPSILWDDARDEAVSAIDEDCAFSAWASDIDPNCLALTRENARRAGVSSYLNIFEADARQIEKPDCRGTIVCNPPYGERLLTPGEVEILYRDMGRRFAAFDPWQIYILTSHEDFERLYGRRADKIKKLYNGTIPCNLYQYFRPKR